MSEDTCGFDENMCNAALDMIIQYLPTLAKCEACQIPGVAELKAKLEKNYNDLQNLKATFGRKDGGINVGN